MITHYDLCQKTAEWAMKKFLGDLCIYEYQSYASAEHPDVLLFKAEKTKLFEVKVSLADFKKDPKKEARTIWKTPWYWSRSTSEDKLQFKLRAPELYYREAPHLGVLRYYVCPAGLIQPEDLPTGWGLYWVKNGKFFKKHSSARWRRDLHTELALAVHASRKYVNTSNIRCNVLFKEFK